NTLVRSLSALRFGSPTSLAYSRSAAGHSARNRTGGDWWTAAFYAGGPNSSADFCRNDRGDPARQRFCQPNLRKDYFAGASFETRSEERRVGKECSSRRLPPQ